MVHYETAQHAVARFEVKDVIDACGVEIEKIGGVNLDQRRARITRLRGGVDLDGVGDDGQRRKGRDRARSAAADIENDEITANSGVGAQHGLPQRTGSRIGDAGDGKGCCRSAGGRKP